MYKGFEEKRKFFPRCSVDIEESNREIGEVRWRLWERDGLNVFLQDCFWVLTKEGYGPRVVVLRGRRGSEGERV